MSVKRKLETQEDRDFWQQARKAAEAVAKWPRWKRGSLSPVESETPPAPREQPQAEPQAPPSESTEADKERLKDLRARF